MDVVNLFYELARQQESIRGFAFGKGKKKGAGTDIYPLVWLDDPLTGSTYTTTDKGGILRYIANVDFLGIPKTAEDTQRVQNECFYIGLTFFEKIKQSRPTSQIIPQGFSFVSLSEYYDDNAAGYRFTYTLDMPNPVDRCAEYFDPTKVLPAPPNLPDFAVDNPSGCAVFGGNRLPDFTF